MRERSKLGIAIAAMIKMIATTISNSIREKPFCLVMTESLLERLPTVFVSARGTAYTRARQVPICQGRTVSLLKSLSIYHFWQIKTSRSVPDSGALVVRIDDIDIFCHSIVPNYNRESLTWRSSRHRSGLSRR